MFNFVYVNKFIAKYFGTDDCKVDFERPQKNLDPNSPHYKECLSAISLIDNLDRENITITSYDGTKLSARFFDLKSKKTVICLHDADKDPISQFAMILNFYINSGCNILVPYSRGYYLSKAKYHSFGYLESFDLRDWIIHMINRIGSDSEIYVHGIGMGANSICMVNALEFPKNNVKGFLIDSPFLGLKDFVNAQIEADNVKNSDDMKIDIYKAIEKNLGFNISKSSCITPIKRCEIDSYFACKEKEGDRTSIDTQTLATFCPTTKETLVLPCDEFDPEETYLVDRVAYNKLLKKFINEK